MGVCGRMDRLMREPASKHCLGKNGAGISCEGRLRLRKGLQSGSLIDHELQCSCERFTTRTEQLVMIPRQDVDHARAAQEVLPGRLRMKKADRPLGGQDQLRRPAIRTWDMPTEGDKRPDPGRGG